MILDLFTSIPDGSGETVVVVDTETTGLRPEAGDRLLEVAAVKLRGGEFADSLVTLVNPERGIPPEVSRLHGITSEMVTAAPKAAEVLLSLLAFLGRGPLVFQNAPFDLGFLAAELRRAGLPRITNPVLDTRLLARSLWPELAGFGLGHLARRAGVSTGGRHRALADAEITARVFLSLREEARRRELMTLADLVQVCQDEARRETEAHREIDPQAVALLETSLRAGSQVSIRYATRAAWRRVTARHLDRRYLVAFCHESGKELTFRLDRVREVRPV